MIVAVSANPSVDKLFEIERLTPGAIHRPSGFVQVPGGKGLNVARAAAALGADVHAVALLRGHAGLVTRGARGVVVSAPDGSRWEGRLYVRGRYPVASGDSFLAGLVVALERGRSWPDAIATALGAAAANAEVPGAGRLDPARADLLAAGAEVRPLEAPSGATATARP